MIANNTFLFSKYFISRTYWAKESNEKNLYIEKCGVVVTKETIKYVQSKDIADILVYPLLQSYTITYKTEKNNQKKNQITVDVITTWPP